MAPKDQQKGQKFNKRKEIGSGQGDAKSVAKKPKRFSTSPASFPQKKNEPEKQEPQTKRESRLRAKELAEARKKKRKRHYTLEQDLALLWEKMRRRNISKEDRSKLVSEAVQKMKGKIPEIASSHVSSRVLQTCVKYCSQSERDAVFEEIQPHFLTLACNTYAVHLVKKMLDHASKKQLARFISALHGHVASLLRHMVGSLVVEHAYQLGDASQKLELVVELYSPELKLFKDLTPSKDTRLLELITKLGLQKGSVRRHMASVVQPILEKGIVDHSIIHRTLMEYLSLADKTSASDIVQQLSGALLLRMIHTRDGCRIGMLCVKYGSSKERKKIIKGMKGYVSKVAHDQCGSMILVGVFSVVDDTKLITKIIIRELQKILKELILDKNGRRPLLQLLHPNCSRYLSPDDLASLNLSIPSLSVKDDQTINSDIDNAVNKEPCGDNVTVTEDSASPNPDNSLDMVEGGEKDPNADSSLDMVEGGRKDPNLRRKELLVNSGLAQSLTDVCIESAGEFLKSNFGKDAIYEVATGGSGGILYPDLEAKICELHEAVASLAAEPKSEESEHVLENFHSSRMIRKLVLDCSAFASTLWKLALKGKCKMWAEGHSQKVVCAFLESSDAKVRKLAKEELQPLVDAGILKVPDTKPQLKKGGDRCE